MSIAGPAEPGIAAPAVGVGGFVVAEVLPDEGGECVGRNIGDPTKPNPATASTTLLDRGGDDRLLLGARPGLPGSGPPT